MSQEPDYPSPTSTAQFWSSLGLTYEAAYGSQDVALIQAVQNFLSYLSPHSTILECGCGTGVPIARTIASAEGGYHYHGIDIAEGMVALCEKQVPEGRYQVVDMLTFEPKGMLDGGEGYDGIVASLSHFQLRPEEHVRMVRKWREWLRPGGYVLVSTITTTAPSSSSSSSGEEEGFGKVAESFDVEMGCARGVQTMFLGYPLVVTIFTQDGWRKLLGGEGFEIVSTETDFFRMKTQDGTPDEPRFYVVARKVGGG